MESYKKDGSEVMDEVLIVMVKNLLEKIHHWSNNLVAYLESMSCNELPETLKGIIVNSFDQIEPINRQLSRSKSVVQREADKSPLTAREKQCLELFMKGCSAKLTAKKLNISYRTVEYHLARIKKKFNSKNMREVVYRCQQDSIN